MEDLHVKCVKFWPFLYQLNVLVLEDFTKEGGLSLQGFSGMNRFSQSTWSKVQCEMILAFLSFVDYFRPKYFLLENVRNFVSFNKGQTFRLTLASLLEMGYQVDVTISKIIISIIKGCGEASCKRQAPVLTWLEVRG